MAEFLKSNPSALRQCILYEVLGGTPAFKAWKNFCARFGQDVMDYIDFEFWYMRFVNREFDLQYDRSLEPKRMHIQEMPLKMLTDIFGKMNLKEKLLMQKVSKCFRECVQQLDLGIKTVEVNTNQYAFSIRYGEASVDYIKNGDQCEIVCSGSVEEELRKIFGQPNSHLDTLEIHGQTLFHASQILPQLQLSKVNQLKIYLDNRGFGIQCSTEQSYEWLNKICEMAAEVKSFILSCCSYNEIFIECFMNLHHFYIMFNELLSDDQLDEIFTKIQLSTVLETFTLQLRCRLKETFQHVVKRGKFTKIEGTEIWRSPKIENENAHLEVEMFEERMKMVVTKIRL